MVRGKLTAALGIVLLFGAGVAAAALGDPPPTATDPTTTTTSSTTTTTTTTTTTEATTTTVATTSTTVTPPPMTTTTASETTTVAPAQATIASAPPRRATRPRALPHAARVSDTPTRSVRSTHPRRKKQRHRISKPLEVTPPLGRGAYVFPVVGSSGYGDSYGGFRGDVHGKWHHGDDIFAPLGAPVVAVANGTINRVGWHEVGGWRLWVRDAAADQFYYAHLSGYAPGVFHSKHVQAGDVLGFVGNTGDAFGGLPHLHFEIHPHQLLRRGYDGAVDPTTYLDGWPHLRSVHAPFPVHPRLPKQPRLRGEARQVFRQLLIARRSLDRPTTPIAQPEVDRPEFRHAPWTRRLPSVREEPALPTVSAGSPTPTAPVLAGLLVLAVFVAAPVLATMVLGRIWRNGVF